MGDCFFTVDGKQPRFNRRYLSERRGGAKSVEGYRSPRRMRVDEILEF
jgi:hypothetical protein